jgi:hypothetical protein
MISKLTENDPQIIQPSTITIPLMSHQKTIVKRMLDIEDLDEFSLEFTLEETSTIYKNAKIQTNIGILADKVGAGKTLSAISVISMRPQLKNKLIYRGINNYMCVKIDCKKENLNTNLIIVPHKLVPQWKKAFEFANNLKVFAITTNGQIDSIVKKTTVVKKNWMNQDVTMVKDELIKEQAEKYNVILIGDTMYKRFNLSAVKYKWNRIFIDEADTIKLPRDMKCHFNFMWLITGTPSGLINKSKPFVAKLFAGDNCYEAINYVTFKNDDEYIKQSIVLPHPKRIQIRCLTPKEILIIKDLIPSSILQMINAGNSEEAIKALNCNVDTNENILQVITKNLIDSIANKEIELDAEKKKHYHPTQKKEQEHKIKIIENSLGKLQEKCEDIKKKIYELNNDYCPVCMGAFTNPVIVNCCKNCFCFDCLAVSMGELKNNICPFCRQGISKADIHLITDDKALTNSVKTNDRDMKDKMVVLTELICKKPEGSFMVFANYAETFNKIEKELSYLNISYHILKGQASTVAKYIDDFTNKKVRVLMLNAQYFGAGMNLQMTTDLVIFHRFTKEMEEQIIGRAQRLGRTCPLNVYYLIHDNESSNIEDTFDFEEVKNIHYLDWIEQQEKEQLHEKQKQNKTTLDTVHNQIYEPNSKQIYKPNYNDADLVIDSFSDDLDNINDKIDSIDETKFGEGEYIIVASRKKTHVIEDNFINEEFTLQEETPHKNNSNNKQKSTSIHDDNYIDNNHPLNINISSLISPIDKIDKINKIDKFNKIDIINKIDKFNKIDVINKIADKPVIDVPQTKYTHVKSKHNTINDTETETETNTKIKTKSKSKTKTNTTHSTTKTKRRFSKNPNPDLESETETETEAEPETETETETESESEIDINNFTIVK